MSAGFVHPAVVSRPSPVNRETAAKLLHAARSATAGDDGQDAIEWAFSMLPDSAGARRLRTVQLIERGDFESADALIARGLRQRPTDPGLSLLRARSLFAQGRLEMAGRELRLVLTRRPDHTRALVLAGRVALGLGEPREAVRLLGRAERGRGDRQILDMMANAWLDAGEPRLARKVIKQMPATPALLRARVLRTEGRFLEAAETLERARQDPDQSDYEAVTLTLFDLLEDTANLQRLRRLLAPLTLERPALLVRAGAAWLAMGAFQTAAVRMATLSRLPEYRSRALVVLLVAGSMMNRTMLARRVLERLRRMDEPIDGDGLAEAWCRGLLGRVLLDQCSARQAGTDPHTGRLRKLLRDAAKVLNEDLAAGEGLPRSERLHLQHHLAVCDQAAALVDDPEQIMPPAPYSAVSAKSVA